MPRKPKALTGKQRAAALAERRRSEGLIPRMVWARPEHWELIKAFVEQLTRASQADTSR